MKKKGSSPPSHKKIISLGAAVAAIVLLGIVYQNSISGSQVIGSSVPPASNDSPANSVNKLALSSLVSAGSAVKGDPAAPVTIVEFGDFQCPNCARFATSTEPQLEKEYFETGRANMVFKHVPIRGPDSVTASIAAECAKDQGKFWEFHDMLFEKTAG